jgi:hypothetical protein
MGMSAKETGRLPVRTDEDVRLVWHTDDCVVAPGHGDKEAEPGETEGDGKGDTVAKYGWVPADECEVSDGAWIVTIRLLSDGQLASALSAPSTLKQDLAAVRMAFRDFTIAGEGKHKMKRKERLAHFRGECAHFPVLVFHLGTYIRIRSQGQDPSPVFAHLFRDDEGEDGGDGGDST